MLWSLKKGTEDMREQRTKAQVKKNKTKADPNHETDNIENSEILNMGVQ